MSDKYYVDEDYISEILILLKAWIDTDKNIAIKKVLYKNNSLLFFKNPNATDEDTPEYKIDMPVEKFLDQTKTTLVQDFAWNETDYPDTENPNLDGNPVLILAVKGNDDSISYSFLNMKYLLNLYQASEETSTVTITIDVNSNVISASVNISSDSNNSLSIGSDGGLYSPSTDLSQITTTLDKAITQIQELQVLCDNLNERITILENKLNTENVSEQ